MLKAFPAEHPFCVLCRSHGKLAEATVAHHIKAAKYGGADDVENLMALCNPNSRATFSTIS